MRVSLIYLNLSFHVARGTSANVITPLTVCCSACQVSMKSTFLGFSDILPLDPQNRRLITMLINSFNFAIY